jgi:transposase, IS30 family
MSYKQLSPNERHQIYVMHHEEKISFRVIAKKLGRSPSTITREYQRNQTEGHYLPDSAQAIALVRREESKSPFLKVSLEMLSSIKERLKEKHSPDQLRGRMLKEGKACVSHELIYQMIYADHEGLGAYKKYLRQGQPKRRKRGGEKSKRGQIPNRRDIDTRPRIADLKVEIGHWEGDTVIGKNHQGGLVTLVDKCSKFLLAGLIRNKTALHVRRVSETLFSSVLKEQIKTVTFDNGKEFSEHEKLSEAIEALCYFAKPYHSWERGLNEHTNGLLRQYFPKSTNFKIVKSEEVKKAVDSINDRPRKSLGYRTPREVFLEQLGAVALQN